MICWSTICTCRKTGAVSPWRDQSCPTPTWPWPSKDKMVVSAWIPKAFQIPFKEKQCPSRVTAGTPVCFSTHPIPLHQASFPSSSPHVSISSFLFPFITLPVLQPWASLILRTNGQGRSKLTKSSLCRVRGTETQKATTWNGYLGG